MSKTRQVAGTCLGDQKGSMIAGQSERKWCRLMPGNCYYILSCAQSPSGRGFPSEEVGTTQNPPVWCEKLRAYLLICTVTCVQYNTINKFCRNFYISYNVRQNICDNIGQKRRTLAFTVLDIDKNSYYCQLNEQNLKQRMYLPQVKNN